MKMQITMRDTAKGTIHLASFELAAELSGASVGFASFEADGVDWRVPAVLHINGEIIQFADWQAPELDEEELIDVASNPMWAHHWESQSGEPCVIVDGLPRVLK